MRTIIIALALTLGLAGTAAAQNTVVKGKAFQLTADSAATGIASFRLYRNNVVVTTKPVSALVGGVITFDEPGTLAAATYDYEMTAVGDGTNFVGESAKSNLVKVTVALGPPPAPTNNRYVLVLSVATDGTLGFQLQAVQ
jgi:flagellar hook assembly protein FlgD